MAAALRGTVRMAAALVGNRRSVDLSGLDQDIGRLCARVMDLPADEGRCLLPSLHLLAADLDALTAHLQTKN